MVHRLKVVPPYFQDIKDRKKNFEIRLNDRNFHVGDIVVIEELHPLGYYTGEGCKRKIKYVLKDCPQFGLKDGYCIFGW
jgi:ASC-1-like (ASCH) protein